VDVQRELDSAQFYVRRQSAPTGRWVCDRCGATWTSTEVVGPEWWKRPEGGHVCPDCGSWAFTVPA
jgi:hypothetical protein